VSADFGANDWLVEEMYERYQQDPNSVEPTWIEFFKTHDGKGNALGNTTNAPATSTAIPQRGTPPVPKSAQRVESAPVVQPTAPVAAQPVAPVQTVQPVVTPTAKPTPTPADPISRPAPVLITPGAARLEPIRGVSARVVQSMEGSLSVPTATSVRVVPAKLMIDNRIVINNHLKRGRGGKVSFTHIIAYAMIKALREMPEMNAFFGELEGKPAVGHPEHINLGIAIDLAKEDGSRQLLVPSIKGCEDLDFGQFWNAYEEVVRKARTGALTVEDFAGTTVSLTNPGTIGTVHSVPRLVQGQGLIVGVGAHTTTASFKVHSRAITFAVFMRYCSVQMNSTKRSLPLFEFHINQFSGPLTSTSLRMKRSIKPLEFSS